MQGSGTLVGTYDPKLVVLAAFIAVSTSYVTFDLAGRTWAARATMRAVWCSTGALVLGAGVWAMQYVALAAWRLPVAVQYDLPSVGLAFMAAMLAFGALLFIASRPAPNAAAILGGALAVAAGLGSTEYLGVTAARLPAIVTWDSVWGAAAGVASLLWAVLFVRLAVRHRADSQAPTLTRVGTAIGVAALLAIVQYLTIAAVVLTPVTTLGDTSHAVTLAPLDVALAALAGLALALRASAIDRRFAMQAVALVASEARHRVFFQRSMAGMYQSTLNGELVECNDAYARLFGYPNRDECLRHQSIDHFGADAERRVFVERLKEQRQLAGFEVWLKQINGTVVWVLGDATLLDPRDGRPALIEGTLIDITERKQAERAMQKAADIADRANKAKTEFVAKISHEVRTSMNTIVGMTDLTLESDLTPEQRDNLVMSRQAMEALLKLLEDTLKL